MRIRGILFTGLRRHKRHFLFTVPAAAHGSRHEMYSHFLHSPGAGGSILLNMAKKKNSLVENINRRKKNGTSRSKKKSTVSKGAYKEMQSGWSRKKSKSD